MENFRQTPPKNPYFISVTDWLLILLLLCIPIVNLVMLAIWGFGGNTPPVKANFAKAYLIFILITYILMTGFLIFLFTIFRAAFENAYLF